MKKLKILGIYRNPQFSNNAIEVDRLILEESISQLQQQSPIPVSIEMMEEAEVKRAAGEFSLVLTMAQAEESLAALDRNLSTSTIGILQAPSAIATAKQ